MPNALHRRTSFVTPPPPTRGAGIHAVARQSMKRHDPALVIDLPRANVTSPRPKEGGYFTLFDLGQDPAVRAVVLGTVATSALAGFGANVAYAQETIAPSALATASTSTPSMAEVALGAVLKAGDSGPAVSELQSRLTRLGFPVAVTGTFGSTTEEVLKRFQSFYDVQSTGKLGRTTLAVMDAAEQIAMEDAGSSLAYVNGKSIGSVDLKRIDGKVVSTDTANAIRPMILAARKAGIDLEVVSGFRTNTEQRALYRAYVRGHGNLAAPPGYSEHQNGRAIDFNTSDPGVYGWLKKHAGKYGFTRTVPSERWHWELTNPKL